MRFFRFKPDPVANEIKWPLRPDSKFTPANEEKVLVMKHLLDLLRDEEVDTTFIELVTLMGGTFEMRFQADPYTLIQQIDLKHKDAQS